MLARWAKGYTYERGGNRPRNNLGMPCKPIGRNKQNVQPVKRTSLGSRQSCWSLVNYCTNIVRVGMTRRALYRPLLQEEPRSSGDLGESDAEHLSAHDPARTADARQSSSSELDCSSYYASDFLSSESVRAANLTVGENLGCGPTCQLSGVFTVGL